MGTAHDRIFPIRPSVDSPLGRWIAREIDEETYRLQIERKRAAAGLPKVEPGAFPLPPRRA